VPRKPTRHWFIHWTLILLVVYAGIPSETFAKPEEKRTWLGLGPLMGVYQVPGSKASYGLGLAITPAFRAEAALGVWGPDRKSTVTLLLMPFLVVGYTLVVIFSFFINGGKSATSPDEFMASLGLDGADLSQGHTIGSLGGRLLVPGWDFSPSVGVYAADVRTWGNAEGFPQRLYQTYYTAGFDWHTGDDFSITGGLTYHPNLPYSNKVGGFIGFSYTPTSGIFSLAINAFK